MIKYNLTCDCGVAYDSWFYNSFEYDRLKKKKLLTCPQCNSTRIKKSIMSPNLPNSGKKTKKTEKFEKEFRDKLAQLRNYVEKNYKYVGDDFTREARSIHYDRKTSKGIYGKATLAETEELLEEGIEVATIPWVKKKHN